VETGPSSIDAIISQIASGMGHTEFLVGWETGNIMSDARTAVAGLNVVNTVV